MVSPAVASPLPKLTVPQSVTKGPPVVSWAQPQRPSWLPPAPPPQAATVHNADPSYNPAASGTTANGATTSADGPAQTGSPYLNTHNTGGGAGAAVSGQPGFGAINDAQSFIQDPNAANFTIGGADAYRNQLSGLASQYGGIGAGASDFANAQANLGYKQAADFQNSLNAQTQAFTQNASGLGAYDQNAASQGQQQQQDAYNAVANLAAGNGPSLAGKNLQAGLNSENQAIAAQAMTNQGLNGAGNTQRNLLNAQAANANNFAQAGGQASAAEQLGALGQQSSAASNLRAANQAQQSAAASAGLAARSQNLSALQGSNSATLSSQQLQDNNALSAQQLGYNTGLQSAAGQGNAYGQAYNTNVLQQGQNAAFDAANRATGSTRAGINIEGQLSEAQQAAGATSTAGNIVSGLSDFATSFNKGSKDDDGGSDENIKTDIMKGGGADSALAGILDSLLSENNSAAFSATPSASLGSITPLQQQPYVMGTQPTEGNAQSASLPALNSAAPPASSKKKDGGGSSVWGALGTVAADVLPFLFP